MACTNAPDKMSWSQIILESVILLLVATRGVKTGGIEQEKWR